MIDQDKLRRSDAEVTKHINKVRSNLHVFVTELEKRGLLHDKSKLESPEREIFAENFEELGKTIYGTPEYYAMMDRVKPAIVHHHSKNRHHPENWSNGVSDMTLIDLLEMLADWKAATERNKDGNIKKSIEHNAERFNISPQLAQIMENTVREHFRD